jgi:probable rRNA maturation factor
MSSHNVSISIDTTGRGWASAWRTRDRDARAVISAAAAVSNGGRNGGSLEVVFASDATLRELNRRFRGKDKPTNVLSFPNPLTPFGSIILAFETIRDESLAQNKIFIDHAKHMILHGFLHLLGYDHEAAAERRLMERLEIRILADMGIPNPYLLAK